MTQEQRDIKYLTEQVSKLRKEMDVVMDKLGLFWMQPIGKDKEYVYCYDDIDED